MDSYIGIDVSSTRTGLAIIEEGKLVHSSSISPKKKLSEISKLAHIIEGVLFALSTLSTTEEPTTCIETPIRGNSRGAAKTITFSTVMYYQLTSVYSNVYQIYPSTVKKWLTDDGNAKKPAMLEAAQRVEPSIENHDEADAYSLATIAEAINNYKENDILPSDEYKKDVILRATKVGK